MLRFKSPILLSLVFFSNDYIETMPHAFLQFLLISSRPCFYRGMLIFSFPAKPFNLSTMVKIMTKLLDLRVTLEHLQRCIFKIFFKHGEGIMEKWVKLRAILDHLRIFLFHNFFNHVEGNHNEISQIESHSKWIFKILFNQRTNEEIRVILDHF